MTLSGRMSSKLNDQLRRMMLILLLLLSMNGHHCNAVYIYGLVLHNPIPDDLGLKSHLEHQTPQQPTHPEQLNFRQHQTFHYGSPPSSMNNDNSQSGLQLHPSPSSTLTDSDFVRIRCKQDSHCIDDDEPDNVQMMYCDQHYGFCDYFRQIGELCRHDSQCDQGLICMFGKCQKPFKPGHKGARCNDSSECNHGLCCARQHGERICKPKLKLGQQCFVPLGGLDYSLNELCPCDEGLECRTTRLNIGNNKNSKRKRKNEPLMRCSKPTTISPSTTTTIPTTTINSGR